MPIIQPSQGLNDNYVNQTQNYTTPHQANTSNLAETIIKIN